MSDTAAMFDAFAFLAALDVAAEASAPLPAAPPAPAGFSGPSSLRVALGGLETVPQNGFRDFSGVSPGKAAEPAAEPVGAPSPWRRLPFGPERGAAFALARQQPGACRTCSGRRWWRHPDGAPCCAACHPPDHLPAAAIVEVWT